MERKIGEIFEHNGEWYQCVKGLNCLSCCFNGSGNCDKMLCSLDERTDSTSVFFKKLEKYGEPYLYKGILMQPYRRATKALICDWNPDYLLLEHGDSDIIDIEIKQTKEDMEENENNRTNCAQCGDKRFEVIARAKAHLLEATNIANDEKEMAVIDNILFRCYQMGWLERYEEETKELDLKPFSLEAAKAGKPVCTRDGRKARIICFDAKDTQPIIGLYEKNIDGIVREYLCSYHTDGRMYDDQDTGYDLMMLPEKKEGWVNIYRNIDDNTPYTENDNIYSSRDKAKESAKMLNMKTYIDTIKISWEE